MNHRGTDNTEVSVKCFLARVELEVMVVAESERDAAHLALDGLQQASRDVLPGHLTVTPATRLADGWEPESLVYGRVERDVTAAEALELNRASTPDPHQLTLDQLIRGVGR